VKKALEIKRGGLDVVFEASGNPASVTDALNMVKPGGKVVLIGIHPAPAQIQTTSFVRSAKTIIGAYGYDAEIWNRALTLMNNGQVKTAPIITHVMPFQDAKRGFELLVSKEATKVILTP
jgi:threonine dehydrogenase-like Zn-dependent dehydrogenase